MVLQHLGHAKDEAEGIMGAAVARGWRLVNLPFREEYPGGRQWNLDAAQFKYKPAELADDEVPHHPHWDMIFDHIGHELTPALRDLPWASRSEHQDRGRLPPALGRLRLPRPLPAAALPLLLWPGGQREEHLLRVLQRLVTKGVVKAERSLTSEFNGELSGAIICAVEEMDISKAPGAHAKIKEYSTGRTILIRKMRHDCFDAAQRDPLGPDGQQRENCPVFPGDTRITVISVSDLLKEQKIAKPKLEPLLDQEAPHFLYTLMHLELPPMIDRLRLPVVTTASKQAAQEDNQTALEQFIAQRCEQTPEQTHALFADFYDRFQQWLGRFRETRLVENPRRQRTARPAPDDRRHTAT